MSKLAVLLLLTGCATEVKKEETFWYEPCLTDNLKVCGDKKLDPDTLKISKEDREITMCRIHAMVQCRKPND